jgi:hypothetical protein
MVASFSINPSLTTNAAGLFSVSETGYVQGFYMDDPASRNWLSGGLLDPAESLPMWGGVGIYEHIPLSTAGATTASAALGGYVGRATTLTAAQAKTLTGFSVFNQAYNGLTSPQSTVPLTASGMSVNFFRLGSQARIAVQADPALISLDGAIITSQVSWDFVNQRLVPYLGTLTITSGTYSDTTGVITLTMSAPITFGVGDAVILASLTGTGGYAALNGTYTAQEGTTGSTVVLDGAPGAGASTITGGNLTLGSGASSLLNVRLLAVQSEGNLTVNYDADTNFATWNQDGPAALILI